MAWWEYVILGGICLPMFLNGVSLVIKESDRTKDQDE